jgi:hypothetical protein
MLQRVALVRTDVSEELSVSFIRVTRIGELWTTLGETNNRRTLRRNNQVNWLRLAHIQGRVGAFKGAPYGATGACRSIQGCFVSRHRGVSEHSRVLRIAPHSLITHLGFLRSVRRLLVTASLVPSSQIPVTLTKEALSSSETSVLTRATWRNIPEDAILHSHRRENLKSYIALTGWPL